MHTTMPTAYTSHRGRRATRQAPDRTGGRRMLVRRARVSTLLRDPFGVSIHLCIYQSVS
jgi:hypothetical protein